MKIAAYVLGICSIGWIVVGIGPAQTSSQKLTGWLACEKCTASRVAKGDLRPSNPECALQCIKKGDPAVFLSEQGKELLRVKNFDSFHEDLGFHVEVAAKVDAAAKTISIDTVKRLDGGGAFCSRPPSRAAN